MPSSLSSNSRLRTTVPTPGTEARASACEGVARTKTAWSTFRTVPRTSTPRDSIAAITGSWVRATALAIVSMLVAATLPGTRRTALPRESESLLPADGESRTTVYWWAPVSAAEATGALPSRATHEVNASTRVRMARFQFISMRFPGR